MAGIIAIYGLVVAVLIAGSLEASNKYTLFKWVDNFYLFFLKIDKKKHIFLGVSFILVLVSQ